MALRGPRFDDKQTTSDCPQAEGQARTPWPSSYVTCSVKSMSRSELSFFSVTVASVDCMPCDDLASGSQTVAKLITTAAEGIADAVSSRQRLFLR